tara:strand:+ start:371 stop:514 length:144 start_codon:yes stop_codon:yes gene_type:complete
MEVNELIKIINEIGFPIFISVMFIFRIDKKLQAILNNLKIISERLKK